MGPVSRLQLLDATAPELGARERMRYGVWLGLVALGVSFGCGTKTDDSPAKPEDRRITSAALIEVTSCEDVLDSVREKALADMNARIDDSIQEFGERGCWYWTPWMAYEDVATAGAPPPSGGAARADNASSGPSSTTGTNNQVSGVDEADFVKNDGRYIYLAQNGVLRILEAWPAEETRERSVVELEGTPKKLFVDGDRALVYVSIPRPAPAGEAGRVGGGVAWPGSGGGTSECTYGYDCDFTGDGQTTKLVIFDVSDRTRPLKVREIWLSGSLIAARRIGHAVHSVVSDDTYAFPELKFYPEENLCDYVHTSTVPTPPPSAVERARRVYERLRESNRAIIASKDLSGILPRVLDSLSSSSTVATPLCRGLYRTPLLDGTSFTTVVSVDPHAADPIDSVTILSRPGAVYASGTALYMAVRQDRSFCYGWYEGHEDDEELSSIHKFRIGTDPAGTAYAGSGLVKGHALNQFAMDEKDDHLRIATTSGWVPSPDVASQVTVLGETREGLETVGFVGGLGPSEDIRSVRFDGDRGFIVTFKKTDPLFVLDLADPSNPRVLGELKIPGFSTYMHMLDENHLITIGYDADDHGDFAYFDGVMIQIFDVTDPRDPTLAHKLVIGSRGSSSEALTNHLAFTYYPERKILALPMTVCEGGDDGRFGDHLTFSGLMVFNVDLTAGISERGRVAHPLPVAGNMGEQNLSCYTWWSAASSEVKRSIFFDEYVYSISDDDLKVQNIDALGTDLASLPLR